MLWLLEYIGEPALFTAFERRFVYETTPFAGIGVDQDTVAEFSCTFVTLIFCTIGRAAFVSKVESSEEPVSPDPSVEETLKWYTVADWRPITLTTCFCVASFGLP